MRSDLRDDAAGPSPTPRRLFHMQPAEEAHFHNLVLARVEKRPARSAQRRATGRAKPGESSPPGKEPAGRVFRALTTSSTTARTPESRLECFGAPPLRFHLETSTRASRHTMLTPSSDLGADFIFHWQAPVQLYSVGIQRASQSETAGQRRLDRTAAPDSSSGYLIRRALEE